MTSAILPVRSVRPPIFKLATGAVDIGINEVDNIVSTSRKEVHVIYVPVEELDILTSSFVMGALLEQFRWNSNL